ncbi:MAG: hypothetical protein RLZZ127_1896 [Planctomycetota bacterium]|jgi:signal transduction histidine kinase
MDDGRPTLTTPLSGVPQPLVVGPVAGLPPGATAEDRVLALQDQLQARQDALAHLGHDLRTPLNSIIGFSELLMTGIGGALNPKHREFVEAIHRNGHVMLGLINDLLDWSTVDGGRAALRLSDADLGRFASDVRACTEPVIQTAGLAASWPDPAALAGRTARIDAKRLLQVALNLIDNARKFTPRGGSVAFALDLQAGALVLTVEDSGPGIPKAEADRMFKPYWSRSPLPAKTAQPRIAGASGTGLGMSIVQAVVRLHGGAIEVDRGSLGGARFRVTIPGA